MKWLQKLNKYTIERIDKLCLSKPPKLNVLLIPSKIKKYKTELNEITRHRTD